MEFALWPEYLYVLGTARREILDGPGSEDGVLICCGAISVVARCQDKTGLGVLHPVNMYCTSDCAAKNTFLARVKSHYNEPSI